MQLWDAIVWYEKAIAEDTKALADDKQVVIDRTAERARLVEALGKATQPYDKTYFTRMIEITDEYIKARTALIADEQKLVDEEWRILKERIAQYEKCVKAFCPKTPVSEAPPLSPPSTPVLAPPPPPPEHPHTVERPPTTPPITPPKTAQVTERRPTTSTGGDGAICGPKVTDKVFATLAKIRREFQEKPQENKDAACGNLYGPLSYNSAWDIEGLDPTTSPGFDGDRIRGVPGTGSGPQATYDPSTGGWKKKDGQRFYPWLTRYSNACAIPRPDDACAATVQFMGTCQHAQIVNYVMWGAVNKLCGVRLDRARAAVHARGATDDSEMVERSST